jgi:hypothetical protein
MIDEVGATAELEEVEVPQENTIEDDLRQAWKDIQDRERDELGRFKSKEEKEDLVQTEEPTVAEEVTPVVPEEPKKYRPNSWRKEATEHWDALPDVVRQEIEKREADFHNGIKTYKEWADWGKQFEPLSQDMYSLKQQFGSEAEGLKQFFELDRFSRNDPQGFIRWFADVQGIDLGGLVGQPTQASAQQAPRESNVEYERRIRTLEATFEKQRKEAEDREIAEANKAIEAFRANPENAHFDLLRDDMAKLLSSGIANSIESAYEKAIWAREDLRAEKIAKQQSSAVEKSRKEAEERAKAAKKASAPNLQSRGVRQAVKQTGSLEDDLRDEARKLGLIK